MCPRLSKLLILLLPSAALLVAQSEMATLHGTVTNSAGKPLRGATLIVTDVGANEVVREVETTESGAYELLLLKPGTYRVTIDEKQFDMLMEEKIVLEPGQVRLLDLKLTPEAARPVSGEVVEPTTIHENAPPSGPENGILGYPVDFQGRWNDAPLVDRHPTIFPLLATAPAVQGNGAAPIISGISNRDQQTWAWDGVPHDTTTQTVMPAFVETAEVTIANPGVEASRPVNVNLVSKRGGETLHGSFYAKAESSKWDARPFFNTSTNSYLNREAQGELSGAIIPNRTYFYAAAMYQKIPYVQTLFADVPTAQMRSADFSQYLNASTAPNGQVLVIRDPRNGAPFGNNQIPSTRQSAVALKYLTYLPSPNVGGANTFAQNYSWGHLYGPDPYIGNWPFGRLDQKISNTNQVYGHWLQDQTALNAAGSVGEQFDSTQTMRVRDWGAADVWALSSRLVNQLKFGRTAIHVLQGETESHVTPITGDGVVGTVGLQGVNPYGYTAVGFPAVSFNGSLTGMSMAYGGGYGNKDVAQEDGITNVEDSLTWSLGRHTVKAGVQYMHFSWTAGAVPQDIFGSFSFSGLFTGLPFADFMLGLPATSSRENWVPDRLIHQAQFGGYAADSFRVSNRLTLDYGVHWDYFGTPVYNDGFMANWDPTTGHVIVPPGTLTSVSTYYPAAITVALGQPVPKAKTTNFRPRAGAAYRLMNNLVLRGAYGEYTVSDGYGTGGTLNGTNPWDLTENYTNTLSANHLVALTWPSAFPASAGSTLMASQSVTALPAKNDEGKIRQYNGTLDGTYRGFGLRASYVGSRGVGMNYSLNTDKPRASTTAFTASRNPFPQFVQTFVTKTDGAWHYDSLVFDARRRAGPVTFDSNFTWANNISNYANTTDPYNVTDHWTRDAGDRRLFFVASAAWKLPLGKGQRFLSQGGPIMDRVFSGWSVQAIVTAASGQYYSPLFTGPDPANASAGYVTELPDCVGNPSSGAGTLTKWFNPAAFAVPSPSAGRYGSCGMNILEGYPVHVGHASLSKQILLIDRFRAVFTAQVSNVTNTPHFTIPNNNLSNLNPGAFTAASLVDNSSLEKQGYRQIDLKLRLEF